MAASEPADGRRDTAAPADQAQDVALGESGEPASGEPPATESPETGRQAAWNYLIFVLSKSSTLIMTVVVARMLEPAEFGLFALT
ncbi:MAG: hypothetical protein V3U55_05055, partial [Mycobacterium sp.]